MARMEGGRSGDGVKERPAGFAEGALKKGEVNSPLQVACAAQYDIHQIRSHLSDGHGYRHLAPHRDRVDFPGERRQEERTSPRDPARHKGQMAGEDVWHE